MSIATKLADIYNYKVNMAAALTAKGVATSATDALSAFANKISAIPSGGAPDYSSLALSAFWLPRSMDVTDGQVVYVTKADNGFYLADYGQGEGGGVYNLNDLSTADLWEIYTLSAINTPISMGGNHATGSVLIGCNNGDIFRITPGTDVVTKIITGSNSAAIIFGTGPHGGTVVLANGWFKEIDDFGETLNSIDQWDSYLPYSIFDRPKLAFDTGWFPAFCTGTNAYKLDTNMQFNKMLSPAEVQSLGLANVWEYKCMEGFELLCGHTGCYMQEYPAQSDSWLEYKASSAKKWRDVIKKGDSMYGIADDKRCYQRVDSTGSLYELSPLNTNEKITRYGNYLCPLATGSDTLYFTRGGFAKGGYAESLLAGQSGGGYLQYARYAGMGVFWCNESPANSPSATIFFWNEQGDNPINGSTMGYAISQTATKHLLGCISRKMSYTDEFPQAASSRYNGVLTCVVMEQNPNMVRLGILGGWNAEGWFD
jgi:hypothetical protein